MDLGQARESIEQIRRYAALAARDTPTRTLVQYARFAEHHAAHVGVIAEKLVQRARASTEDEWDAAAAIMLAADAEREATALGQRVEFFLAARAARRTRRSLFALG